MMMLKRGICHESREALGVLGENVIMGKITNSTQSTDPTRMEAQNSLWGWGCSSMVEHLCVQCPEFHPQPQTHTHTHTHTHTDDTKSHTLYD